jgi:hypothetical protein
MQEGHKLDVKWLGMFKALERLSNNFYQIVGAQRKLMNFNVEWLKSAKPPWNKAISRNGRVRRPC